MHLLRIHRLIEQIKPACVIVDPITNLMNAGEEGEVYSMLLRLIDFLKNSGITAVLVSLTVGGHDVEKTSVGISSLSDTWILLRDIELNGERNRCLYVLKSRGMAHSNQLREFTLGDDGIKLIPAYIGQGGVLTGSSRLAQEAKEESDARRQQQETLRKQQDLERRHVALQAQIAALQVEAAAVEQETRQSARQDEDSENERTAAREQMAKSRRSL